MFHVVTRKQHPLDEQRLPIIYVLIIVYMRFYEYSQFQNCSPIDYSSIATPDDAVVLRHAL